MWPTTRTVPPVQRRSPVVEAAASRSAPAGRWAPKRALSLVTGSRSDSLFDSEDSVAAVGRLLLPARDRRHRRPDAVSSPAPRRAGPNYPARAVPTPAKGATSRPSAAPSLVAACGAATARSPSPPAPSVPAGHPSVSCPNIEMIVAVVHRSGTVRIAPGGERSPRRGLPLVGSGRFVTKFCP